MKKLWAHLKRNRELYFFPAVGVLVLWLALQFVVFLTGRVVLEDPGQIVGYLYNAMGALITVAIAGPVQALLFGFRVSNTTRGEDKPRLADEWTDHVIGLVLLVLIGGAVFGVWGR